MTYLGIFILAAAAAKLAYWFLAKMIWQEEPPAKEVHTVRTSDGWRIKLFRSNDDVCVGEPVLLVHGVTANAFDFLYPKKKSLVDTLVAQGYDCWVIDMRGNQRSQPPIGTSRYKASFEDLYAKDIPAAIAYVRANTEFDQVHWVGHSMGGMVLYAYVATQGSEYIATGTTMGTPPGLKEANFGNWRAGVWFVSTFPFVAEVYMKWLVPFAHFIRGENNPFHMNGKNMARDITFYNTVEVPPRPLLKEVHDWALKNEWIIENGEIDMHDFLPTLDIPLHLIGAPRDNLAPLSGIESLYEDVASTDKQLTVLSREHGTDLDYDHKDILFGKNASTEVFDPVAVWLREHGIHTLAKPKRKRAKPMKKAVEHVVSESAVESKDSPPSEESTSWGKVLEDASSIMSSLDDGGAAVKAKPKAQKKRKAVAKKKVERKKGAKKSTAKKAVTKKVPVKKKAAPAKTKTVKKKTVAKKAAPKKKVSTKKPVTKKAATKKKVAVKKKAVAKKKPVAKKSSPKKKAAKKKKTVAKEKKKKSTK